MEIPEAPVPAGTLLRGLAAALLLAAATLSPGPVVAQVASQSVNMVSGIQWPGGDPFLQRQNEPSVAVSSRNPRHLLAGANDYRAVDLPFSTPNAPETGDAWLGVFKSFDGGITWRSTLLPGYPQQVPRTGPLSTFTTAADPVVRAGTNGLFYYSGIAFHRDTKDGVVFVARFMDLNNKENGDPALNSDPIRYIDTKVVDSAAPSAPFIDKPWIAVDKPRLLDGVCHLTVPQPLPGNPNATVSQTVPAGDVYAAWTEVSGTGSALTTNVFFSSSRDCGGTWSQPVKLNGTNKVNQGASIAIDPATGVIYVVWRRLASGSQTDAIMMTRSFRGLLFPAPSVVVSLPAYNAANPTAPSFFDQGTTEDSFRTTAYPTIGIDRRPDAGSEDDDEPDTPTFRGKIFVAWSQRGIGPGGDARVVLSVSTDDGSTWSAPKPVDNSSLTDDTGHVFSRGHQFMPQMTVTADKITIIYYDARFDHTFGLFSPISTPLIPDPVTGKLYLETRALKGELLGANGLLDPNGVLKVFTPFFVETGMTQWRHTIDLRFAQADAAVSPVFSSSRLSQYSFGTRGDETGTISFLQQLQINPPNLKLFQEGTVPFIGDYIDVAGSTFLPPRAPGRRWRFNSLPGSSPVFLASWTSNQDVVPPLDGDWTHYTPAGSTTTGVPSVFNPAFQRPTCVIGQEGMRNQNIYAARISQGLAVTSVQNAKPLSSTLQRDLALSVENLTPFERTFRLTIAAQPAGGRASFVPAPNPLPKPLPAATTTLDVVIPAKSAVARSVYALSTDPHALIEVDVAEVNGAPGGPLKANGLTGFIIFNTDPSAPTLIDPDNTSAPSVTTVEIYNPNVSNPNVSNPNVSNPNVSNPNVSNPNVSNPNVSNPNVSNPNVSNADLANPNVSNPNVSNPNVSNPNVSNPNVSNPNVSNAPVSDATYTVTNTGNTTATYRVELVGTAPAGTPLQLIITKPYANPASQNCVLFEQQHNIPVANVVNPEVVIPGSPPNSGITDSSDGNATFVLGPGESILVTIRAPVDVPTLTNIIQNLAPVVVAHAPNTNDPTNKPATSPPVITTTALPDGVAGQLYSAPMTALGGTPPYTAWTATGLPALLSIGGLTGVISGTPAAPGTYAVGVSVMDSASKKGNRSYTLRIASPLVIATASLPNGSVGVAYSQPLAATGGLGTYTWILAGGALPPGIGLSPTGVLAGTPTSAGTSSFTVRVTDSAAPAQATTRALTLTVASVSGPAVLTFTVQPGTSTGGQPMPSVAVRAVDGTASPVPGASITIAPGTIPCSAANLTGPTTAMTDPTGVATFPGLSIDRGGWGYTLAASVTGNPAINVGSSDFNIEGFCDTGSMATGRGQMPATLLNDGKVLLTGGTTGLATATASAELFDPAGDSGAGSFNSTASMTTARTLHQATFLQDGRVLVTGGSDGSGSAGSFSTAELYDPTGNDYTGSFVPTGSMGTARSSHSATPLPDGRVLVSGGANGGGTLSSAEVFDPSGNGGAGAFTPTGNMTTTRAEHMATPLLDGRVLVSGGVTAAGAFAASAEIYDPTTGTFSATGSMSNARGYHTATLLSDGKVLVTGGRNSSGYLASAEIYDPAGNGGLGTFSSSGTMAAARGYHASTLLTDGTVLISGGTNTGGFLDSSELYDPTAAAFIPAGTMSAARRSHGATLLPDGRVLIAGGVGAGGTSLSRDELFYPFPPTTFLVTNTADAGVGSLRQAILDANTHPGRDAIHFNIPGAGIQIISPASPLPDISDPVLLDATTQPGYAGTPLIRLDGASLSGPRNGLELLAGNSLIHGFMITRFPAQGIQVTKAPAARLVGNFVGTDGSTALGNAVGGIRFSGSSAGLLDSNVVSANNGHGIDLVQGPDLISTSLNNYVVNNKVGVDSSATSALGNLGLGIYLDHASNNTLRGNIVSGNAAEGVWLVASLNNRLAGNRIGTNAAGTLGLANGSSGIVLWDANDNTVGGKQPEDANVISGNAGAGIYLYNTSNNNVIFRNRIGTDITGSVGVANTSDGVHLEGLGVTANRIENNVLSGNTSNGVSLFNGSYNNTVVANKIGTNALGTAALANGASGIALSTGASGNRIGGATAADSNLISGNVSSGIFLMGSSGDSVQGNLIGTDVTGTTAIPNGYGGVVLYSTSGETIGGTGAGAGNLISGNTLTGLSLGTDVINTLVAGNRIGTNVTGSGALPNTVGGISVFGAATNGNVLRNNVVSGNLSFGVSLATGASHTLLAGNFIGTNLSGAFAVPNVGDGIDLGNGAHDNVIGTTVPGEGNVIAFNTQTGVLVRNGLTNQVVGNQIAGNGINGITVDYSTTGTVITANRIGTNADGTAALGNAGDGIGIYLGASGNLLSDNVIAASTYNGVRVDGSPSNTIRHNWVGTNAALATGLGNANQGISVAASTGTTIGGTNPADGNVVAYNVQGGIGLENGATNSLIQYNTVSGNTGPGVGILSGTGNAILSNSIFGNTSWGIFLNPGANNDVAAPAISSAVDDGSQTTVIGVINLGAPSSTVYLQFFANNTCEHPPAGEGQTLLGTFAVVTDVSGMGQFTVTFPTGLLGKVITATTSTLLGAGGNTSEFSACAVVVIISEYAVPTAGSVPKGITAGSDGAIWFTESTGNKIGRITTAGVITEFPIPTANSWPYKIAAGPDGNLWFTEANSDQIGRISTAGVITEFPTPTSGSGPVGISAGPDGAVWFTEVDGNQIGRITTAGVITEFPLPATGSSPIHITPGPDGALWFTEYVGNRIGRITTTGVITEFPIPTAGSKPDFIAAGPDGALWFTEYLGNRIGRITAAGVITEYPVPTAASAPIGIAAGPDGALWFTEFNGNQIGRITTTGVITEYPIPTAGSGPDYIAAGPDGAISFTEFNANQIGKLQ